MKWVMYGVALLLAAAPAVRAQGLSRAEVQDLERFREKLAQQMNGPQSPLGMVALEKLQEGYTSIGSAPGSTIRLARVAERLGEVRLHGEQIEFLAPPGGFPRDLTIGGKPASAGPVGFDADGTSPTFAEGSVSFVLRRKFGHFLVARDTRAPDLVGFHGLRWYAPEARYRVVARWRPWPKPRVLRIANILGQVNEETSYGVAEFTLNGRTFRLEPSVLAGRDLPLFFVFRDTSSRTSTYGAGRFLDASVPSHGLSKRGTVVLDFNRARNPWCAFSVHTSCPLPPEQNRLPVAIPAGEKRYFDNDGEPKP